MASVKHHNTEDTNVFNDQSDDNPDEYQEDTDEMDYDENEFDKMLKGKIEHDIASDFIVKENNLIVQNQVDSIRPIKVKFKRNTQNNSYIAFSLLTSANENNEPMNKFQNDYHEVQPENTIVKIEDSSLVTDENNKLLNSEICIKQENVDCTTNNDRLQITVNNTESITDCNTTPGKTDDNTGRNTKSNLDKISNNNVNTCLDNETKTIVFNGIPIVVRSDSEIFDIFNTTASATAVTSDDASTSDVKVPTFLHDFNAYIEPTDGSISKEWVEEILSDEAAIAHRIGASSTKILKDTNKRRKPRKKEKKAHICVECGHRVATPSKLREHLISHTGQKPFICPVCGDGLSRRRSLEVHMLTHSGMKAFKCTQCGMSFTHKSTLDIHWRTHTGAKPYKCTICGMDFAHNCNLTKHIRGHTGEKLFKCKECNYACTASNHLKRHQRKHTGERPYSCAGCGATFTRSDNYKTHLGGCLEYVNLPPSVVNHVFGKIEVKTEPGNWLGVLADTQKQAAGNGLGNLAAGNDLPNEEATNYSMKEAIKDCCYQEVTLDYIKQENDDYDDDYDDLTTHIDKSDNINPCKNSDSTILAHVNNSSINANTENDAINLAYKIKKKTTGSESCSILSIKSESSTV